MLSLQAALIPCVTAKVSQVLWPPQGLRAWPYPTLRQQAAWEVFLWVFAPEVPSYALWFTIHDSPQTSGPPWMLRGGVVSGEYHSCCGSLRKSFHLSDPQFPHLKHKVKSPGEKVLRIQWDDKCNNEYITLNTEPVHCEWLINVILTSHWRRELTCLRSWPKGAPTAKFGELE